MNQPFPITPRGYPFVALEHATLERWRELRIFERTLEKGGRPYVFYEGPPTANNVPHVGHVVTRVVKDLVPRYQTMKGRHVPRKAGWDTHGLAVEIEVEKRLGLKGKQQIEEYGVAEFNAKCLESVHTYTRQWEEMSERVGYWLDFDGAYFTYRNDYIESVWWSVQALWKKGLLAESYRIQPYCARCGTTLSSHEVAQNYKEADDPSIWTIFRLLPGSRAKEKDSGKEMDLGGVGLVAWTTTPWTTLANVGVAVNPQMVYKLVAHPDPAKSGQRLILSEELDTPVPVYFDRDGTINLPDLRLAPPLALFRGSALEGLEYDRLFKDFEPEIPGRVVLGDYVTRTEGTGLVHTAPPFGEDDYQTGQKYGLPMILSVESDGRIAAGAKDFAGLPFKEADRHIIRILRARGLLLHADRHRHNYPFCWRCDQPLLYYATKGWFVRTTARREDLIANNRKVEWHPAHVGEGRFGNWLENVVDWAISRRRYWGTPLPIWRCGSCDEWKVVGSFRELFGGDPPAGFDPHRPFIDEITLDCRCGGTMRRVPEVLDAWYDSGAMPFAQGHFMGGEPPTADFIAEAVDQTRGWFYTLHVLATLLFDQPAYRHCIVLGHINDEQGRKMSKRLGNVVDPMPVMEETGADALRWYFCVNDPEATARFSSRLVRESAQNFLIPLWNALSFFTIYANIDGWRPGTDDAAPRTDLDRWILLRLDQVIQAVTLNLENYSIAPAARALEGFVDELTNWYIRRSRDRFWAGEKGGAYPTLYTVLTTLARLIAPFMPFVAEVIHGDLVRSQSTGAPASVHLEDWPTETQDKDFAAVGLVQAMALAQRLVDLGRAARSAHDLKTRQPLAGATVVFSPAALGVDARDHVDRVRTLILDELNVKELRWAERRSDFVRHEVRPNFRALGRKLGPRMKAVQAALASADGDELAERLERDGRLRLEVGGESIDLEAADLEVRPIEKEGMATARDDQFLLALDTQLTPDLIAEGQAREIVNRIQTARKDLDLPYTARIRVRYRAAPELEAAIDTHRALISGETLAVDLARGGTDLRPAPIDELDFAFELEMAPEGEKGR